MCFDSEIPNHVFYITSRGNIFVRWEMIFKVPESMTSSYFLSMYLEGLPLDIPTTERSIDECQPRKRDTLNLRHHLQHLTNGDNLVAALKRSVAHMTQLHPLKTLKTPNHRNKLLKLLGIARLQMRIDARPANHRNQHTARLPLEQNILLHRPAQRNLPRHPRRRLPQLS